jgi:hypothetical protein
VADKVINLRRARKQKARSEKEALAEENRVKFGRTKQEKARDLDEKSRAIRLLDQKKLDPEDEIF